MHRSTPSISARWLHRAAASAALVLLPLLNSLALAQTQIPLPPQEQQHRRPGLWFTAPAGIVIYRPAGAHGCLHRAFGASRTGAFPEPRAYPASTNSFTSLFRVVNDASSGILPVSIPVARGDTIGVLGSRGDVGSSPQPGPVHHRRAPATAGYLCRATRRRTCGPNRPTASGRVESTCTAAKAAP